MRYWIESGGGKIDDLESSDKLLQCAKMTL